MCTRGFMVLKILTALLYNFYKTGVVLILINYATDCLFQVNETLAKLRLNGNKIKTKGGMAIAGALQVNTMLEELDLAETDQVMYMCLLCVQ